MTFTPRTRLLALAAAGVAGVAGIMALVLSTANSSAATTSLCHMQTAPAAGGAYTVQNNEWGSTAPECITTGGNPAFTVANSAIHKPTNGAPGGYPSVYKGCHRSACTVGSGFPVQVAKLRPGMVTTSWSTSQPGGSSAYDVAYDIWFNQTAAVNRPPDGAELMIWLNQHGSMRPFGSEVATDVSLGGRTYNIWFGKHGWNTVSYTMTSPATSVSNLDIRQFVSDAISRGYIRNSWYLVDVEAGFELWQGGAGLATKSFSVKVGGGSRSVGPRPSASQPSPPSRSGATACSVTYSVVNRWPGGVQGQAVITNTAPAAVNGWALAWTFPGDQKITHLWNGSYTQSGQAVRVTNASYDSSIPPGGTATVGFTAASTGNNTAAPSAFTLNGRACA